jgi:hypothetical protein
MSKITKLDNYRGYISLEMICVKCYERSIHILPEGLLYKDCECDKCRTVGTLIATGQEIFTEER